VFQRQFEIVVEHKDWWPQEKSTYLITALKGWAADVLYGIQTNATYEETLQALEGPFGDQNFAAAFCSQPKPRSQRAGESLQDFATAVEQFAHRTYPTLHKDHIRREAGKTFAAEAEDHEIEVALLIRGEKTVNEALR
jgi:hypothetical protein